MVYVGTKKNSHTEQVKVPKVGTLCSSWSYCGVRCEIWASSYRPCRSLYYADFRNPMYTHAVLPTLRTQIPTVTLGDSAGPVGRMDRVGRMC